MIRHLVSLACGVPHDLDSRPMARWPMVTVLRTSSVSAVQSFVKARRERDRVRGTARDPLPEDLSRETAQFMGMIVDDAMMTEIVRAPDPRGDGLRSSKNSRLCSLVLEALKAIYVGEHDQIVNVPIDLRRFVPKGRVDGNFLAADPLGMLLSSDWAPSAISERLLASVGSGTLPLSQLASTLGPAKAQIMRRFVRGGKPERHHAVAVSMLNERADFPAEVWVEGATKSFGTGAVGPWPSSTFAFISTLGKTVRISIWDESGLFPLDRFKAAFERELEKRIHAVS